MAAVSYGNWTAFTFTSVESLASSANFDAGGESTAVDLTDAHDCEISGNVTVNNSSAPTVDTEIRVYLYADATGATTYPDVLDGTDSAETFTSPAIARDSMYLAAVLNVDETTTGQQYWMRPVSVQRVMGFLPEKIGVFVTHNTGQTLHSTGSTFSYRTITYGAA